MTTNSSVKRLAPLWSAQLISSTGDAIYQIALIWLVLDITGSATITGLVALSAHLPAMLFGLLAGVFADRYHRLRLMLFSNITQAAIVFTIPILLGLGYENITMIGLLAFARSAFGTLFPPALNAFVPTIFSASQLVRVNSLLATSAQLAYFIGPAAAAVLLNFISLQNLFTLDGISFLLAMGLLMTLRTASEKKKPAPVSQTLDDLKLGLDYVLRRQRTIGMIIALTIINNLFIMGPAIVGMPILVKTTLNGCASDYAAIEACYAIGMLISSFVIYRLDKRLHKGLTLMLGMIVDGLTFCLLFIAPSVPVVMVLIIIHALGIPMITVSRTAIIQHYVPNELQGRVFSMVHLAVVGLTGISSALVGVAADFIPMPTIFLIIGIGAAICGVVGLLARGIRTLS